MKLKKWARKEVEPRSSEEIQKEYNQNCLTLGNLDYQIEAFKGQQNMLRNKIHELVLENQAAQKKASDVKPE